MMSYEGSECRPFRGAGSAGRFTDIHCHCLPGLDDGPGDMAEALRLCRALVDDRIAQVVATPHQLGRFDGHCNARAVRQAVEQLNQTLHEHGITLTVLPGADIRIDERIPQLLECDEILTAGDGGRYLLLELPHEIFIDPQALLERLCDMGLTAVITHPERHGFLLCHPDYVSRWCEYQPCLQITAASLAGDFGRASKQAAWAFLHTPLPVVVATDAHDADSRAPRMMIAYRYLTQQFGRVVAEMLCVENPRRLLAGDDLLALDGTVRTEVQRWTRG